ncbi:YCF48-related protein [Dechloromonas agitata]|uniref:WD40/YVTN/BNR-like repeat-containing protein n=1 Tax=Dechloromonas agitata TaxID=73030 RepID=UPI00237DAB81|nr:YCF48-related protein [Dechloromonas agitata]MDE1543993.1 YCF48-related protein [Dechloromonas agitata]
MAATLLLIAAIASPAAGADLIDPLFLPARSSTGAAAKLMIDVAVLHTGRLVAVGEQGTIILSDDKGKSWRQALVPVSVNLTAVFFANAESGWAVGHDGVILGTKDGGLTWSRLFDGNAANEQIVATAERRVRELRERAGAAALQRELERAEDALADAKAGARFGPAHPLFGLYFKDARQGFAAGAFGQLFRTDDGGATWRYIGDRLDNPEGFHYNAIVPTPSGKIAVVGEGGVIHFSADGGKTWQRHETGYNGQLYGMLALSEAGGGEVLIAYGFGGRIFSSRGGGSGWTEGSSGLKTNIVAGFIAADGLPRLVGASGQILSSDDGRRFVADASAGAVTQKRIAAAVPLADGTLVLAGTGGVHLVSKNEK